MIKWCKDEVKFFIILMICFCFYFFYEDEIFFLNGFKISFLWDVGEIMIVKVKDDVKIIFIFKFDVFFVFYVDGV